MKKFLNNNKKVCLFGIGIILLVLIIVVVILLSRDKDNSEVIYNPDAERFVNEYEVLNNTAVDNDDGKLYPNVDIPSDNVIDYSNSYEILEIFDDKETAVVYFGYSTCLYCRSAIEVLCDAASETDLDKIYYLDAEKKDRNYTKIINVLGDSITVNEKGVKEIPLPLVLFISRGDIVSYWKGTLSSQKDPYIKLDASQKQGLKEIYINGINDVISSK